MQVNNRTYQMPKQPVVVVCVDGCDGWEVAQLAGTDHGHRNRKGYNGRLFSVSLAGWSVACLNSEFNGDCNKSPPKG